jgi:hypothetical protein
MRFDTEETFFRAVFNASGTSPMQIVETARLAKYEIDENWRQGDVQKRLTTEIVRLMRGAFTVHQRADAHLSPGDSLLGLRLTQASNELPDGWQIAIVAQRGSVRLDLYDPSNERYELSSTRQELSGLADEAIDAAIRAEANPIDKPANDQPLPDSAQRAA